MNVRRYWPGPALCRVGWHRYVGMLSSSAVQKVRCVWCGKTKRWHG